MKRLRPAAAVFILAVCPPVPAQMKESIDIRISTDQKAEIDNDQLIANACAAPETSASSGPHNAPNKIAPLKVR